jgi:hypothetical protein
MTMILLTAWKKVRMLRCAASFVIAAYDNNFVSEEQRDPKANLLDELERTVREMLRQIQPKTT